MEDKKPNWFWVHRRNASLNHFSFLMHGLSGEGWSPAVDFWFDNQIVIGVPKKGCYVFYDKNQLSSGGKFRDVQESIDKNPNFVKDFKKQTEKIFGEIFDRCELIDKSDLENLSKDEMLNLYDEILKALMVGPIITVQLWGIEACLDENYKIIKFLRNELRELGKVKEFQAYKEMFLVNIGETVAFTERKDFLKVAEKLYENKETRDIFLKEVPEGIEKMIVDFQNEDKLIENHINKYEFLNKEYVSGGWSKRKWLELFKKALQNKKNPNESLKELMDGFKKLNDEREKIIKELDPPKDVLHAMDSLAEFIAQRDWAKGYFTKALLSYNSLLFEIARRIGASKEEIFNYSYLEIKEYLKNNKKVSKQEMLSRLKDGFTIVIRKGKFSLITGKKEISDLIKKEKIEEPFEKIEAKEFRGLVASKGIVRGNARVVENVSEASGFKDGEILVTYMTTIEFIPLFRKAKAVVTDEGGMSSHAAIISREFGLPCIVGTKIATKALRTGDEIEVDAEKGVVRIIK